MNVALKSIFPEKERLITHAILFVFSIAAIFITAWLEPSKRTVDILTDALGYVALLQLAVTLLIGPLNMRKQRRNPVNIDLRRDTGIWAGITGVLHVIVGFQVHMGGEIVRYFFDIKHKQLVLSSSVFGITNDIGLIATIVLVILLVLSNDWSMRKLKGKLWKWLQRLNYLLAILVIVHTFGYQIVIQRAPIMTQIVAALSILVLVAQFSSIAPGRAAVYREGWSSHRPCQQVFRRAEAKASANARNAGHVHIGGAIRYARAGSL